MDPFEEFLRARYGSFSKLDEGGMGEVYRCSRGGREVAVKRIRTTVADAESIERFRREIKILGAIDHPNVIKLLEYEVDAQPLWYEMEYAPQGSLSRSLGRIRFNAPAIRQIFLGICAGLRALHEAPRPIVHRDLKPGNVLLFDGLRPKLSDVGLARHVDAASLQLTYTGSLIGTLAYVSPEQLHDPRRVDHRTDIYSLGVLIYEMFTGETDRAGVDLRATLQPPFHRLVDRMCRRDPGQRYQSVAELLEDFHEQLDLLEGSSAYADPEADFARAATALAQGRSSEQLRLLVRILEDQAQTPTRVIRLLGTLPSEALGRIADWQPDVLDRLLEQLGAAIDALRGQTGYDFDVYNTATDVYRVAFGVASRPPAKEESLRRLALLAYDLDRFAAQRALPDILASCTSQGDISLAMDVFQEPTWCARAREALAARPIDPTLRNYLARRARRNTGVPAPDADGAIDEAQLRARAEALAPSLLAHARDVFGFTPLDALYRTAGRLSLTFSAPEEGGWAKVYPEADSLDPTLETELGAEAETLAAQGRSRIFLALVAGSEQSAHGILQSVATLRSPAGAETVVVAYVTEGDSVRQVDARPVAP